MVRYVPERPSVGEVTERLQPPRASAASSFSIVSRVTMNGTTRLLLRLHRCVSATEASRIAGEAAVGGGVQDGRPCP